MKINVDHVPPILKPPAADNAWPEEMERSRDQIGGLYRTGVVQAIETTTPHRPFYEGHLRNGIHFDALPGNVLGARITVSAIAKPYAPTMELGRRPGKPGPPLAPIKAWAMRKLGLSGKELDRAAFLIRRKIHVKGTAPRHFFKRAREDASLLAKATALVLAGVRAFKKRVGEHDR